MRWWLGMTLLWGGMALFGYDFSRCGERIALSSEKVGDSYGLAIDEKRLLHYSKTPPKGYKILKSDPYVGLYLLEAKKPKVPLELRDITPEAMEDILGVGTPEGFVEGNITQRMSGWLAYARFSQKSPPNSIISSICYQIYGLGVGGNEFIESSYIKRFLEQKSARYGDLLIRFEKNRKEPVVALIDPFIEENPFRLGDRVLSLEGRAIGSRSELENQIYGLAPGREVRVSVMREGEVVSFETRVYPRIGGMLLPDHLLERVGLRFSQDWSLQAAHKMQGRGLENLQAGDQILRVNGIDMPQGEEGLRLLSRFASEEMSWLIRRGEFEFFIKVNKKPKNAED